MKGVLKKNHVVIAILYICCCVGTTYASSVNTRKDDERDEKLMGSWETETERKLSFEPIAEYEPVSSVTDVVSNNEVYDLLYQLK